MSGNITQLLQRWKNGDADAGALVVDRTYRELRQIAAAHMRRERFAESLGATGLLHEAYLRLLRDGPPGTLESRQEFLRLMAAEMRRRLIDRARRRLSAKRGAGADHEPFDEERTSLAQESPEAGLDLERLDRALETLVANEPRAARVVELRFLIGMTTEETAAQLGVSTKTVKRDWTFARAWLASALDGGRASG